MSRWLEINLQGKSICGYLKIKQYNRIAIYGLGILGTLLVHEMEKHNIEIAFGIDQDEHKGKKFRFPVYRLWNSLPGADVIVVTVNYAYDSIRRELIDKSDSKIVSLTDLINCAEEGKHYCDS